MSFVGWLDPLPCARLAFGSIPPGVVNWALDGGAFLPKMQPWSCDWGVEFIGCRTSCQKVSLSAARHRLEPMAQLASKPDKPAKPAKASQAKKAGQAEAARRARRRRREVRQGLLAMFVSLRWQSKICRARSPLVAACRTQKMRTSRFLAKTRARWQKKCNAHRPSRGPTPGKETQVPKS